MVFVSVNKSFKQVMIQCDLYTMCQLCAYAYASKLSSLQQFSLLM